MTSEHEQAGLTPSGELGGTPIFENWAVKRDEALSVVDPGTVSGIVIFMHPSNVLRMRNNGRTPFWSRWTHGERERSIKRKR